MNGKSVMMVWATSKSSNWTWAAKWRSIFTSTSVCISHRESMRELCLKIKQPSAMSWGNLENFRNSGMSFEPKLCLRRNTSREIFSSWFFFLSFLFSWVGKRRRSKDVYSIFFLLFFHPKQNFISQNSSEFWLASKYRKMFRSLKFQSVYEGQLKFIETTTYNMASLHQINRVAMWSTWQAELFLRGTTQPCQLIIMMMEWRRVMVKTWWEWSLPVRVGWWKWI